MLGLDMTRQTSCGQARRRTLKPIAFDGFLGHPQVKASLIVVVAHCSRAPQLLAKYRPPMPILTLVVPQLVRWGHVRCAALLTLT